MDETPRRGGDRAGRIFSLVGLLMLVIFVALGIMFVLRLERTPPGESSLPPQAGPLLAEVPEPLPVARGLKGLHFGMTREEAKAALPELRDPDDLGWLLEEAGDRPDGVGLSAVHARGELLQLLPEPPPGRRLVARTRIGSEPAACLLAFAVEERLSAMACLLGPYRGEETHRAAERALVTALTAKYGHPREVPGAGGGAAYGGESERRFLWQDAGARLELVSRYDRMNELIPAHWQQAELSLKNEAVEHLQLAARLEREAEERARQEEEARERARLEELRRLQHPAVDFGKDL